MAGLTNSGFEPETLDTISTRIKGKLETFSPGFDFSPESPDGQLIEIMAFELSQAWNELNLVYNSYNPLIASGSALRNLGLMTGIEYQAAERSKATIELQGTTGTLIVKNSIVADNDGNEFYVAFDTTIPSNAQVVAKVSGPIPIDLGTLTTIITPVAGWTSITQTNDGIIGTPPQTEQSFRNLRQRTVMRNFKAVVDTMQARLFELGIEQAAVLNNDDPVNPLPDGTPSQTIHVTIGEVSGVSDIDIATVILNTKGLGCPTYLHPSTGITVAIDDNQGVSHDINFSKADAVAIEISMDITYLSDDNAGAETTIRNSLSALINGLLAGEDVIWSHLFARITPFGDAQINSLNIGKLGGGLSDTNIVLLSSEFATQDVSDIAIVVT